MADQIVVSESALGYLNATRPWVKFLAIVGFVFTGLMIFFGLIATLAFSALPAQSGMPANFGRVFGLLYIVLAVIYLMPCLYLLRYAKAISLIPSVGQGALEDALKNQKAFWKFAGILMIVMLCLYVLIIFVGAAAGLAGLGRHH
ncbi:MAG TPA: hypothetical protein VF651_07330 [Gammaproteobacteria bacterium]